MKKIIVVILKIILVVIFLIIIVGFMGYAIRLFLNGYGNDIAFNSGMEYSAISLQLTFFGIILTLFALGGAILAFIGWKEIKTLIKNETTMISKQIATEEANKYYNDIFEPLVERLVEKTLKNILETKHTLDIDKNDNTFDGENISPLQDDDVL